MLQKDFLCFGIVPLLHRQGKGFAIVTPARARFMDKSMLLKYFEKLVKFFPALEGP